VTLLFTILIFSGASHAANRYVRAGATGSGSGVDWTNACTDFVGICAASNLVRGDTYFVAAGMYGSRTFSTPISGTLTITIKKATVTDHGTDVGWQDSFASGQAVFRGIIQFTSDYWIFDGVGRSDLFSGHGFKVDKQLAPDSNPAIFIGDPSSGQTGIPANHLVFRYVEVNGSHDRTDTYKDTGITAIFTPQTDVKIQYSWIHDPGSVPIKLTAADNFVFEYNAIARNFSSPSFHSEGIAVGCSTNLIVRFNHFEDIEGTALIGAAGCNVVRSSNWYFYGNIFLRNPGNPFKIGGVGAGIFDFISNKIDGELFIFNNSIVNINLGADQGGPARMFNANTDAVLNNLQVRNNLWFNGTDMDNSSSSCSVCVSYTWSHNAYFDTTSPADTSPNKQAGVGSPFVNLPSKNFHLTLPTQDGFALQPPFNVDPAGRIRGADLVADRGAFEFIRPSPPLNLRTP
jgi:hypothetical protein